MSPCSLFGEFKKVKHNALKQLPMEREPVSQMRWKMMLKPQKQSENHICQKYLDFYEVKSKEYLILNIEK